MPFSTLKLTNTSERDSVGRPYWEVEKVFRFSWSTRCFFYEVDVPKGYRTNFASVPRLFWRILPPDGEYREATIIHDFLCDERPCPSWLVHVIFYRAMEELGVVWWKRWLMWAAVRLGGPNFPGPKTDGD